MDRNGYHGIFVFNFHLLIKKCILSNNFKRTGCYVIQKYNKHGHAVIVDAHDNRVKTLSCDMVRPHINQEIPINISVQSERRSGADLLKKKPKPSKKRKKGKSKSKSKKKNKSKKSEITDDDDDNDSTGNISIDSEINENCRSRIMALEMKLLNEGDPKTNISNVDCSKCDECVRIKQFEKEALFTQV